MAGNTAEYRAFTHIYDKLSIGIRTTLTSLAGVALAKELIHDSIHSTVTDSGLSEEIRTQKFMFALQDRVRTDPSAFHSFVELLKDEHGMNHLARIMTESLQTEVERRKRANTEPYMFHEDDITSATRRRPLSLYPPVDQPSNNRSELCNNPSTWHSASLPTMLPNDMTTNASHLYILPLKQADNNARGKLSTTSRVHGSPCKSLLGKHVGPLSEPAVNYNSKSHVPKMFHTAVTRKIITPVNVRPETMSLNSDQKIFTKTQR